MPGLYPIGTGNLRAMIITVGLIVAYLGTPAIGANNILLVSQNPSPGFVDGITGAGHQVTQIAGPSSLPADLSAYHVIILADPASTFTSAQVTTVNNFVNGNKGLVVFENTLYGGSFPITAATSPVSGWTNRKNRTGTYVVSTPTPNSVTTGLAATSTLAGGSVSPTLKTGAQAVIKWNEDSNAPADPAGGVPMTVTYSYGFGRVVYINDHDAHYITENWKGDSAYGTELMRNCIDYAAGIVTSTGLKIMLIAQYPSTDIVEGANGFIQPLLKDVGSVEVYGQGLALPSNIDLLNYDVVILAGGRNLIKAGLGDHTSGDSVERGTDKIDRFVYKGGGLILFEEDIRTSDDYFLLEARCNPVQSFDEVTYSQAGTTVTIPGHPLVTGLATTSNLQQGNYRLGNIVLKAGVQTVIRWTTDSEPMAVTSSYGKGKVVFFNHPDAYNGNVWRGHRTYGDSLMVNAVRYVSGSPCHNCGPYKVRLHDESSSDLAKIEAGLLGHTVVEALHFNAAPSDWALYDAVILVPYTHPLNINFLPALENFVSQGGGLIVFEPTVMGDDPTGGPVPPTSPLSPVSTYTPPPSYYDTVGWAGRDNPSPTLTDRTELTVGLYGPPKDVNGNMEWTNEDCANPTLKVGPSVHMRWTFEPGSQDPPEGRPMLVSHSFGAGRIAYINAYLPNLFSSEWNYSSQGYGDRLIRNALDYVMNGVPSRACGDCDNDGICDQDEIAFLGRADCDNNGVLDSCDLSDGTHTDLNGNGKPDICDPTNHYLSTMRNREGDAVWTYSGGSPGFPEYGYRGAANSAVAETQYVYEKGELVRLITKDNVTLTPQRVTELVYNPAVPWELIGMLSGGCGCAGSDGIAGVFTYHDALGRVTRITTSELPPDTARVLEEFDYSGYRLTDHRRRSAAGIMEVVEHRDYTDNADGSYGALVRLPVNDTQAQLYREAYEATGRLGSRCEYQDLFGINEVPAPEAPCNATTFAETQTVTNGRVTYEKRETVRPSSVRDVREWSIQPAALAYQPGSTKVVESYTTYVSDPLESQKIGQRIETWEYNDGVGDYRLVQVMEATGLTTTYGYDDAHGRPERRVTETRSDPGGLSDYGPTSITYEYNYTGFPGLELVTRPGSNGPVSTFLRRNYLGDVIEEIENYLGSSASQRETIRFSNGFGQSMFVAKAISGSGSSTRYSVQANAYDENGRKTGEHVFLWTGDWFSLLFENPSNPSGPVYRQMLYEYHPLFGALTNVRVVLSDTVPFPYSSTPAVTADTVYTYDSTGVWLQSVTPPCEAKPCSGGNDTISFFDRQRRVIETRSPSNESGERVISKTVYDGRGLVRQRITADESGTDVLVTTTTYNPDGDPELVAHPNGTFERYEYDEYGRLSGQHRCDAIDCAGAYELVTTYQYTAAGLLEIVDPPDTAWTHTQYDAFGRPFHVEQADPSVTTETAGSRIVYNPAGLVALRAEMIGDEPVSYQIDVDQITEFHYDDLGQLMSVRRRNDNGEDAITEYTYDRGGRRVTEVIRLAAVPDPALDLQTETQYDALGRPEKTIDPADHYVDSFYDSRGNLLRRVHYQAVTGQPPGSGGVPVQQERWSYDARGRLIRRARMANAETLPTAEPDPAIDRVTRYEYDNAGRIVREVNYNMLSAAERVTTRAYDLLGRLRRTTDPLGNYEEDVYFPGTGLRAARVVHALGDSDRIQTTAFYYDTLGRVEWEVTTTPGASAALAHTYAYDGADRVTRFGDWVEGGTFAYTRYQYDPFGRRTRVVEAEATSVERTTQTVYDRLGRVTERRIGDEGQEQVTQYKYDRLGRQTKIIYPDCADPNYVVDTVRFQYDRAGRLARRTDQRDIYVDSEYDPRGMVKRRTSACTPNGFGNGCLQFKAVEDTFDFDGLGRMVTARRDGQANSGDPTLQPVSLSTFWYNALSDLLFETKTISAPAPGLGLNALIYTYDQAGNRASMQLWPGGTPVSVTWSTR